MDSTRRRFVTGGLASTAALVVGACGRGEAKSAATTTSAGTTDPKVGALEDLMRDHGVLRRALVVYRETARRLRRGADVPPQALRRTAMLFRAFGEDYHEKRVEEAIVFPALKRAGGASATLADVLVAQHQRGRELTEYIIAQTEAPRIGANAEDLAVVLETFARMYASHADREDTIIFPAWKKTMSSQELDAMGERLEEIEHAQLGNHGFEDAVKVMAQVEGTLGLADLARFTAPAPPR